MESLILLLPLSIFMVIGIGVAFWWAIFAGQFEHSNDAAMSIFDEQDGDADARKPAQQGDTDARL